MNQGISIDLPREKLKAKGIDSLTQQELIQIVLGSGSARMPVGKIARLVVRLIEKSPQAVTYDGLVKIPGINNAKACAILAALELGQRYIKPAVSINKASDIIPFLQEITNKKQEYLLVFSLDGQKQIINRRTVAIGTLNATLVHPREVFADALVDRANSIIISHNHPSGACEPSAEDIQITKFLEQAGQILGIGLVDHIIVTNKDYFSFAENNYLDYISSNLT